MAVDIGVMLQDLARMADENKEIMTQHAQPWMLIDHNDVVLAVWRDPEKEHGVGILPIKGWEEWKDAALSGQLGKLLIEPIPCKNSTEAHYIRHLYEYIKRTENGKLD